MTTSVSHAQSDTSDEDLALIIDCQMDPVRITTADRRQHVVDPIGRLAGDGGYFLAFLVTDLRKGYWGDIVRCRLATPGFPMVPGSAGVLELIAGSERSLYELVDTEPNTLKTLWTYASELMKSMGGIDIRPCIQRVIANCAPAGLINWSGLPGEIIQAMVQDRSLLAALPTSDSSDVFDLAEEEGAPELDDYGVPTDPRYASILTSGIVTYDVLDVVTKSHAAAIEEEFGEGNLRADHSI